MHAIITTEYIYYDSQMCFKANSRHDSETTSIRKPLGGFTGQLSIRKPTQAN
jgi:hypothetical protein